MAKAKTTAAAATMAQWIIFTVSVGMVFCSPGVYNYKKEYRWTKDTQVPVNRSCDDTFLKDNKALARVTSTMEHVTGPFRFDEDKGVMHILEPVNFTHRSLCELPNNQERENITEYTVNSTHSFGTKLTEGHLTSILLMSALALVLYL